MRHNVSQAAIVAAFARFISALPRASCGAGSPLPHICGSRGCMRDRFEFTRIGCQVSLPGIAGAAKRLQAALAGNKKFRVSRPEFSAAAARLLGAKLCIQRHCIAQAFRFPASSVGIGSDCPDGIQILRTECIGIFSPGKKLKVGTGRRGHGP